MHPFKEIQQQVQKVRNKPINILKKAALKVLENPPLFDIEVSSICNLKCSFCPRHCIKRHNSLMTQEVFDDILTMIPSNAVVMFAGLGEPLLNINLEHYIKQLKERKISPCVITNGILLTPERQLKLIDAGVDQLQISYSSVDSTILRPILNTSKHKTVLDKNLGYLSANRSPNLRVQLNFVLTEENEAEWPKVQELAYSWGFELYNRRVHTRGGHIDKRKKGGIKSSCGILAGVTFITCDGVILSCSNDVTQKLAYKQVKGTMWDDIIKWKKSIILNDLNFDPCLSCDDDYRWIILDYQSVDKRQTCLT